MFDVLFDDVDSELSSPIHKTEESFSAEQDEREVPDQKQKKSGVRLARFAMLADTIKQWEDDLRHPTAAISPDVCKLEHKLMLAVMPYGYVTRYQCV